MKTDASKPVLGKFLNGRYKTVQVLSNGNHGHIYVAEDTWESSTPQRLVKYFKPQGDHPKRWQICKRRFTNEAQVLIKLGNHNQIPQFLDAFEDDRGFYLVQELVVGKPLSAELPINPLDGKRWSERECVALLEDVLGILEFVHGEGIIHGNLKPSNLLRRTSDGKLVLIDFGVAHPIDPTQAKPQVIPMQPSIAPVGIPCLGYISAEQLGGQVCPGSDIYALGAIAIQALTGLDPLQLQINPSTGELDWEQHVSVSDMMACVLNNMVRYDFKYRYQSATDVRVVLKRVAIMCEEPKVTTEELSQQWRSDSPSSLQPPNAPTDAEELALCIHDVSRLPTSSFPQSPQTNESLSPLVLEKQEAQEAKEEGKVNKWDYARELASACLPKLPPVVTGIGAGIATSNALAISFGLYTLMNAAPSNPGLDLLQRAKEQYRAGNFDEAIALAKSIPSNSSAYQESVATVQEWHSEWDKAAAQFQSVEQAFKEGRWQDVLEEASNIPDITLWQQKAEAFVQAAQPQIEAQAQELLQQAYGRAAKKDFAGAIVLLKQIHPDTPTGSKIQPKLKEYNQKQQLKAQHLLQQAYQQASEKNFNRAVKYLSQIPEGTPTYEKAQVKLAEYSRKQIFLEEVERQAQLNKRFPKEEFQLTKLPKPSKSSRTSGRLNPGNQLKEVNLKPVAAKSVRR